MKAKNSKENRFVGAFLLDPTMILRAHMDAIKVMSHFLKLIFLARQ